MHAGYCLPEYTVISYFALTETNSLHCILAGNTETGGEWTGPTINCKESALFACTKTPDLALYGISTSFMSNEQGSCTISGQTITVQIVGE